MYYDNYTKILHINKHLMIGIGGFTNWALKYHKRENLTYFRVGKLAFSYYNNELQGK